MIEVKKRLNQADAVGAVSAVSSIEEETGRKVKDAKTLIRELGKVVQKAENEIDTSQLEKRLQEAAHQIQQLQAQREVLQRQRDSEEAFFLEKKKKPKENDFLQQKKKKHTEQLYHTITGIRWRSSIDNSLNGVITDEQSQTARRFSIQSPALLNDEFALADTLWSLIDSSSLQEQDALPRPHIV